MRAIIVTGQPRTGTSLAMQILAAAGIPITGGEYPAYEDGRVTLLPGCAEWLQDIGGTALKIIDPAIFVPPTWLPADIIHMARDPHQQVKSEQKFRRAFGIYMPRKLDRRAAKTMRGVYEAHERAWKQMRSRRKVWRSLDWRFERLIVDPQTSVAAFCDFLDIEKTAERLEAMASAVRPRRAENYKGMLEFELVQEAG